MLKRKRDGPHPAARPQPPPPSHPPTSRPVQPRTFPPYIVSPGLPAYCPGDYCEVVCDEPECIESCGDICSDACDVACHIEACEDECLTTNNCLSGTACPSVLCDGDKCDRVSDCAMGCTFQCANHCNIGCNANGYDVFPCDLPCFDGHGANFLPHQAPNRTFSADMYNPQKGGHVEWQAYLGNENTKIAPNNGPFKSFSQASQNYNYTHDWTSQEPVSLIQRQNTSGSSSAVTSTMETLDRSTSSSSRVHSPIAGVDGLVCQWSKDCGEVLDPALLLDHVFHQHVDHQQPASVCLWLDCGAESADPESLYNHFKNMHVKEQRVGEQFVCLWAGCNHISYSADQMKRHILSHAEPSGRCQWNSCTDNIGPEDDIETHVWRHLKPITSRSSIASTSHSAASEEPGIYLCEWHENGHDHPCGKIFPSSEELQNHAKSCHVVHLKKKTGYFCYWAGCNRRDKPFSQKGKVERHIQSHTGYKSCICDICNKWFSAPQALRQHMRTHTGEKPYTCDICHKSFAQGSALTMHKRTHSGEKPLECDFPGCSKKFSESSNLAKHRKTHNDVGQHRCSFPGCDRSFHRLDQMKRHYKTHGVGSTPDPVAS